MPRIPGTRIGVDSAGKTVYRPLIKISVELPGKDPVETDALVDSGADVTAIKADVLRALEVDVESLPLTGRETTGVAGSIQGRTCVGILRWHAWAFATEFTVITEIPTSVVGRDFFQQFAVNLSGWVMDPPTFRIERAH